MTVVASDVNVDGDELVIWHEFTDVTSAVIQSQTNVTAEDEDLDGTYEEWEQKYTLDLTGLSFDAVPALSLQATVFDAQGNPDVVVRGLHVIQPAVVGTSNTSWVSSVDGDTAVYYLWIRGGTLTDHAITVLKNGVDVTQAAAVTETVVWDTTREGFVVDRLVRIEIDLTSITFGAIGDTLQIIIDLTFPNWVAQLVSALIEEVDPNAEAAKRASIRNCLNAFVAARAANVGTSGGETTIGGSPGAVADAADTLAQCLKNRGMTSGKVPISGVTGVGTVIVGFGTVSGSANLVIAMGADGAPGVSGSPATATNEHPGGASAAAGGDGGAGSGGSGASGGDGTATSTGGTAAGVGGAGGSGGLSGKGGDGGKGTATNKTQGKPATAKGGDGGDPLGNNPGGAGGPASAKSGASSTNNTGGPGGDGTYGTGATATHANGQPGGSDGTGGH
ncbi:MAG: hypothetical protein ACF8XB_21090 [Planctomycetota bacterium JB042]